MSGPFRQEQIVVESLLDWWSLRMGSYPTLSIQPSLQDQVYFCTMILLLQSITDL